LADNIGIKFLTPEEYFLKEAPRPFQRFEPSKYLELAAFNSQEQSGKGSPLFLRHNPQDIVLFVGSPGAGKSSWYKRYLEPLGYKRINQDTLRTRDKCLKVAAEHSSGGLSVAIDNTNADPEVRSKWIELAKKLSIPIRCVHFLADPQVCKHNDAVRAMNSSVSVLTAILQKILFVEKLTKALL
jgi:bifunctional polynucleotide phosphatase/kinase